MEMILTMMNEHVIGFEEKKRREYSKSLCRHLGNQIYSFREFVSEITDVFFCLIFLVFSFIIRICSLDDVDRILVVTTHLISTCCPFRISSAYIDHRNVEEKKKTMYMYEHTCILSISLFESN